MEFIKRIYLSFLCKCIGKTIVLPKKKKNTLVNAHNFVYSKLKVIYSYPVVTLAQGFGGSLLSPQPDQCHAVFGITWSNKLLEATAHIT